MKLPRRLLAGVAVLAAVLAATGCDASPYAARVNGTVITQSTLNGDLQGFAASQAYVSAVKEGGSGTVTGDAPGTFSSAWTAAILTQYVQGEIVHQDLKARNELPDQARLDAARVVNTIAYGNAWYGFSQSVRNALTSQAAGLAVIEPTTKLPSGELSSLFSTYQTSLFKRVCVQTVFVAVDSPSGSVDFPASANAANALVKRIEAGSARTAGSVACYTPSSFESLSTPLVDAVLSLKTGQATTVRTDNGFTVVAVPSRTTWARTDPILLRALSVASATSLPAQVTRVIAAAKVSINPLYGTWARQSDGSYAVAPPTAPTT